MVEFLRNLMHENARIRVLLGDVAVYATITRVDNDLVQMDIYDHPAGVTVIITHTHNVVVVA